MKTNEERLQDLFSYLGNLSHVKADEILILICTWTRLPPSWTAI